MRILILFLLCLPALAQDIIGTSQPFLEIEMVPLQPGTIRAIEVREGDYIKKGQVVASLNSNFLRPALDIAKMKASAQGEIIAAKSQLDLAKNKLQRLQELQRSNHARSSEFDKIKAEVSLAEANLRIMQEKKRIAELEVRQIEFQISQHRVISPIDGVVRKIIKKVGESISGTQPLIKIAQLHKINVESFPLFEQTRSLRIGDSIKVFFLQTKQQAAARVTFIDPVVDFASNTVRIVAVVDNKDRKYRSGLKCTLQFPRSN
ncbi:efflux RND transporter periplasmic adaptor subunit [Candidatus Uabimicrobium amorphum]|uniref:Hemolysin D n=1 Tax=Uabimicrobium amorphum TaxID=2596890 RepID=A0A5S9IK99_UABAM|nr:efflux RND transporter periplasmic adaptor subunit [Candidatus Uabimicrobium amorphum]BBM83413.1 hemolysin D [Candidatus Uabimicrobium amorphum]